MSRKRRREYMPMSSAGILSFSQEASAGFSVPKWFPIALSLGLCISVLLLHFMFV